MHKVVLHSEYRVVQSRYGIRTSLHKVELCFEYKTVQPRYVIYTSLHKTELCYEYESSTIEVRNLYLATQSGVVF